MTQPPTPEDLGSITAFGRASIEEAAALAGALKALAETAALGGDGARTQSALDGPAGRIGPEAASLRQSLDARLAGLASVGARLDALEPALAADLATARAHAARWTSDDPFTDRLQRAEALSLMQGRVGQLERAAQALLTARALLRQLTGSERIAEDHLRLMQDVTAPVAVRQSHMTALDRRSQRGGVLACEIDQASADLIGRSQALLDGALRARPKLIDRLKSRLAP